MTSVRHMFPDFCPQVSNHSGDTWSQVFARLHPYANFWLSVAAFENAGGRRLLLR